MKVSDYITDFLISKGVRKCFSVTGGFAMHLNDSFGEKLDVTYMLGESPSGYAALGWSSVKHDPSVCCVTSGCGATNAITPCMIAYQDSVPVFFISGQVHSSDNIRSMGHAVRGYFGSDCDIVDCVKHITKYSVELTDPRDTQKVMEECFRNLTTGRLGPVWLSVPVDIQSKEMPPSVDFTKLYKMCEMAERPIILAGNGIHISKTESEFRKFIDKHSIPYVVSFFGIDLGDDYTGKTGLIGNRAGNFAIQNADLIICLGCRMCKSITGYNRDMFAREAKIVYVDVDEREFIEQKKINLCIKCDLQTFFDTNNVTFSNLDTNWIQKNKEWKEKWSCELPPYDHDLVCPYRHLNNFFTQKPENGTVVLSSGSIYCVGWHMYKYKQGDRFITSGHGDMGYEVPVAIGAAIHGGGANRVYSIVGDGSFQYSINDLQTIKCLNLPITLMVFNNGGYGAIQITQKAVFGREFGVYPNVCDTELLAKTYGIPYYKVVENGDTGYLGVTGGPILVEIICAVQERFPKISNKPLADGTFKNMPCEEMYPFLKDDELKDNLFISRLK
jgi:acetolactate synthase-1/2/3 large subunit